jgi:hypothetical protein
MTEGRVVDTGSVASERIGTAGGVEEAGCVGMERINAGSVFKRDSCFTFKTPERPKMIRRR